MYPEMIFVRCSLETEQRLLIKFDLVNLEEVWRPCLPEWTSGAPSQCYLAFCWGCSHSWPFCFLSLPPEPSWQLLESSTSAPNQSPCIQSSCLNWIFICARQKWAASCPCIRISPAFPKDFDILSNLNFVKNS